MRKSHLMVFIKDKKGNKKLKKKRIDRVFYFSSIYHPMKLQAELQLLCLNTYKRKTNLKKEKNCELAF